MMKRILASILLAMCALPGFAGLGATDVTEFLKSRKYWADAALYGERSELYHALANTPANASADERVAVAAASLATEWRIAEPVARELIVATVNGESYNLGKDYEERLKRIAAQFRAAIRAQPESPQVWALGVQFWSEQGNCGDTRLRDDYLAKPFSADHYLQLMACENWLPTFVRLNPDKLVARLALVHWLEDRDSAAALAAARWAIDAVPRADHAPSDLQLFAVRKYWILLGENGLTSVLLGEAGRSADREVFLHRPAAAEVSLEGYQVSVAHDVEQLQWQVRRQWLLALLAADRPDDVRAEMQTHPDKADDGYLTDALAGKSSADLYARYVGDGEQGELWETYPDGVVGMRVAARFLAANRMETASAMLREDACNRQRDRNGWQEIKTELGRLPKGFQEYWAQHTAWLGEARRAAGCPAVLASERLPMSSRLTTWPEVQLDDARRSLAARPNYTGKIPLPPSFELIRAERQGDEIRAVCLSPAVDPGGEVSPGGYWMVRSRDSGAHWLRPEYLGFQHQAPYVVQPGARVSMFADGVLRLEVVVAELDPESITFPPVGLALRREAKDLYIDIPMADIERDQDGDGLTDLLEAKLATDPANPDTDGDGLSDSLDDFPQASARGDPSPLAPIIVDVLKRLTGYERAGIIEPVRRADQENVSLLSGLRHADAGSVLFEIIEGDARMFTGLRANGQVIVLSPEQVAEISAHSGPFYPLSFPAILIDPQHTRAFVKWSAGWTGGAITYKLKDGHWVGTRGSEWITRLPPVISIARTSPG